MVSSVKKPAVLPQPSQAASTTGSTGNTASSGQSENSSTIAEHVAGLHRVRNWSGSNKGGGSFDPGADLP